MLFVSSSPELEVIIRPDIPGQQVNQYGQVVSTVLRPALYARFQPKRLDFAQRQRADTAFRALNPGHPYGATPIREGSVMSSYFAEETIDESMPEPFGGWDPIHAIGKFDTATDIDYSGQLSNPDGSVVTEAEVRRLVEATLMLEAKGLNQSWPTGYILLDAVVVEKPWKDYPVDGQGRHKTIEAAVRLLGVDEFAPRVIAFEASQEKPGTGVISAMEALLAERVAERVDDDALSAVIT